MSMQKMVSLLSCYGSLQARQVLHKSLTYCFMTSTEHFKPLFEHIGKLEEALYNIQFEQHWLEAQTERQAIGIPNIFCSIYDIF